MLKSRLSSLIVGLLAVLLIAGCGGSSGSVGKTPELPSSPAGGTFQGVYRNTNGTNSADGGTVVLTIAEDVEHDATLTMSDTTGSGTTATFTGTLNANVLTLTDASGNAMTLTFAEYHTSLGFPGTYTETNGTTGSLIVGGAVPIANGNGSYAGAFKPSGGGKGMLFLNFASTGTVTGSGTIAGGKTFSLNGYIVSEDAFYLVYNDGNGCQNSIGTPLFTGTKFTSKLAEQPSGKTLSLSLSLDKTSPQTAAGA